jgi:hypothetical protein
MALERIPLEHRMVELMDRVLDKGVVVDAAARVALGGIHLIDWDARMIVVSFETYEHHADATTADRRAAQRRALDVGRMRAVGGEKTQDGGAGRGRIGGEGAAGKGSAVTLNAPVQGWPEPGPRRLANNTRSSPGR